ncbi:MAG TPA: recombination mediator RecR [Candidatus Omnitrophota bacterium]|nr:recombination mediator RecR [Candidatus Omnitrophota bacterium]HQO38182.1 recombination mediator RecR [Candidatus Omnitrophota bacterium]HQQ06795.1 recombination mediator RecR [Candidatus Omnitrophota bacterium]
MAHYTESIEKLIDRLVKLPGIGRRSAERIISYILDASDGDIETLTSAITKVKENVRSCRICHNLSESDICAICADQRRNHRLLCVVEGPNDVTSLEKTGTYQGTYHVLLGAIAPLEGKGPGDLKIDTLINRIKQDQIQEVIIATDSDTEGSTTALYLTKVLKPLGVHISRIGIGLPAGSNLEYADAATLSMALESRRTL